MSEIEDLRIIQTVIAGDTEAFAYIVLKYQKMVFKYVNSQFNNEDDAMDITQDIFVTAMGALKGFRGESKFSTWLYSIMVNHCKNHKRKTGKLFTIPLFVSKESEEYEIQIPDHRVNPERDVIDSDALVIIREEIYRLPDDYKKVVVLRDLDGLPYNEIADILGINLSNVKVRIYRGRELLKNRLSNRGLI